MLDKKGLLSVAGRRDTFVDVEGEQVRLLELTGTGRDEYDHYVAVVAASNWRNIRAKLVQLSVVDDKGETLFSANEVSQVGEMAGVVLDGLCDANKKLNGLDEDVDAIEKK